VLPPPDNHHFSAAVGWLELGNARESRAELDQVAALHQGDLGVLEVRWLICAREHDWGQALAVARLQRELHEGNPAGWLHLAYALRRVPGGGLEAAWDALAPAHDRFPTEPTLAYNLACYACQLQKLDLARAWLDKAQDVGGHEPIKALALGDPDLEPLWEELRRR
jgi:Flp pilus assembly protein TadD